MDSDLPPRKRRAYRKPPSPPPPPPPPLDLFLPRRRRTFLTYRTLPLIKDNGSISRWKVYYVRPENMGGYQELRVALYTAAEADNEGVSHDHQAVIYYLTRQDLIADRNQPFKRLDARFNWNTFANSVQRFRIVWVPLNKKSSKKTNDQNKKSSNPSARYSNAKQFLHV